MPMSTHVTVGTNDLANAGAFYEAVLAPLGYKCIRDMGEPRLMLGATTEEFMVLTPADGKPAAPPMVAR
jgi:hypothetical protein